MKVLFVTGIALLSLASMAQAAVSVRASINVQAEISTAVNIYVNGENVTNRSIDVKMKDQGGYMVGLTPAIHIIGNATSATLSLREPAIKGLLANDGVTKMPINVSWYNPETDGYVSTAYPFTVAVYPTLQDVPDLQRGVKVKFSSSARSETLPLGTYTGTYEIIVSPTA